MEPSNYDPSLETTQTNTDRLRAEAQRICEGLIDALVKSAALSKNKDERIRQLADQLHRLEADIVRAIS